MSKKACGKFHGNVMIERIVGRLHVGESDDEAIKYVKSRLAKGAWDSLSPADQQSFECEVKRAHAANMGLYRAVMTGRF